MAWWIWILFGLALLTFEIATPGGFFALFFGFGAIVVGLLAAVGLSGPAWVQWLTFAVLSIVALGFLRGRLRDRFVQPDAQVGSMVGETAIPIADMAPDAVGKVEFHGSSWDARNVASVPITAGQRCRVVRVENLMLCIGPQ